MSSESDTRQAPHPHRGTSNTAWLLIGIAGGAAAYHVVRRVNASPGGAQAAIANFRRFAYCFGLFSACNGSLAVLREKDDLLNWVISGAATDTLLKLRARSGPTTRGAIFGAALFGLCSAGANSTTPSTPKNSGPGEV